MKVHHLLAALALTAALIALAACGGDDGGAGTDYPSAGEDRFENTKATVQIEITQQGASLAPITLQETETIELEGPALITRSDPELDGDVYVVRTEIAEMELSGSASFGDVIVRQSPDNQSMGEVRQREKGQDFPADSFFDVFVEIEVPDLGLTLHNQEPLRMAAELNGLPPAEGDSYRGEDDRPLYTPAALQVGRIIDALHIPEPESPATGEPQATEAPTEESAGPTATEEEPGGPEGGAADVEITVAEGGDPAGHQPFVEEDAAMPGRLDVTISGDTITISGAAPFVEVTGTIAAGGSITAGGAGTVAGRPGVSVAFEGSLIDGVLSGTYALGVAGELPQQQAITYDVSGQLAQ